MSDFKIVSVLNPIVVLTGGPFISAGASGQSTGTVVFSNSNGVSFGLSNGVMTASAAGGGGGVAISAGTNSTSTGTVVFSNANGVSFGMDTNGVVTGTVATNYQSQGAYLTTAMASNRGTDFVQATAAFAGTNASGTIASNGISVSVAATVAQTVQTQASGNIAGIGFTSTTTAGTAIVGTNSTNGLSLGVPAFITTYVNDLTSGRAGTGFTSTTTAGTAITAALGTNGLSMAVPNFLTTAMQSGASTQFVQANAAFFGTNASGTIASNAISISVAAGGTGGGGGVAISAGTNSTSTGTVVFSNASGVSFGMETNGVVTATVKTDYLTTQSVQTQASGNIAGIGFTTASTAGTAIVGTNSTNGLSLGIPAYITTFANDLTSGRAGTGFTSTTTAGTAITAALGTNGLTMGIPQFITTYVNDLTSGRAGTGFTSTTTAGTAITAALGTNGLSMAVPQFLTTAMASNAATISNINVSAGTTSNNLSAFVFSNSNGLAFGLSGSTITGSYSQSNQAFSAAGGSSTFQTLGFSDNAYASWTNSNGSVALTELRGSFFAVSNTTQSSSGTQNIDAISFAGAGGVSVGVSNGSVIISGATGGAGGGAGTNTALALTNLTGTLSVNTNGVSLSLSNLDDHFSAWSIVGNTAGDNSYTLSTEGAFVLQGGNNVTLSGNSNTLVISAAGGTTNQTGPNIAAGGATATSGTVIFSNSNNITFGLNGQTMTASYADPTETIFYRPNDFLTTIGNPINASASVFYCPLDHNLSATRFDIMASVSVTTANNNSSAGVLWSLTACMYTLNGNTLSSVSSITTASEWRWQSNNTASATGAMFLSAPLNLSAGADKYWMAVQLSTRATGLTGAATTSLGNTMSVFGVGSAQVGAFSARDPGQATASSNGWFTGMGMYSGTTNFSTIGLSNLTQQGSNMPRANLGVRMRG